ncbi:uncharacterized protein LOC129259624 isoform X2 [Lytechinus pictus]
MDTCTVCDGNLQLMKKPPVTLCANLSKTNVKVGQVLQQIGLSVGNEAMWNKRRCCIPCYQLLGKWNTIRRNLESVCCEWRERTGKSLPGLQAIEKETKKSRVIQSIKHSNYDQTFRLLRASNAACKVWRKDIIKTIKSEMSFLCKTSNLFPDSSSKEEEFDWTKILDRVQSAAPTFYAVCLAAISRKNASRAFQNVMKNRLGMMILLPLYQRRPMIMQRLLPVPVASTLKRYGLKGKDMSSLKCFGLKTSVTTAMRKSNQPSSEADKVISSWKMSIERDISTPTFEGAASTATSTLAITEPHATTPVDTNHPGFSMVSHKSYWTEQKADVTEQRADVTEQRVDVTSDSQRVTRVGANSYAVKNRISFRDVENQDTLTASDLPIMTYLPSQDDYEDLRKRMCILVERILKDNLNIFANESVILHIPHEYSKESSQKSEYVNLGIIEEDPKTTSGMRNIMTTLAKYIPEGFPVPFHVDQRTLQIANSCKMAVSTVPAPLNRLHDLIPVPQDFNFRSVVIRDIVAELFTPTIHTEEGSLKHLKEYFGHDNMNEKATSLNHADDFLLFITCAFVVGFALQIIKDTQTPTQDINGSSTPSLSVVADEVVRQIWHQIPMNRVADVVNATAEGHDDKWCFCKEDIENAKMVECSNVDCENGKWFHEDCVMIPNTDDTVWYCTPACENSDNGLYCICRKKGESLTWQCGNKHCERGQRFHHRCVRTTSPVSQGKWYCSEECSKVAGKNKIEGDELLDYIKRCTWQCLYSESIRDAEREADGVALMRHWRISMPEFYRLGHDKHFSVGHRLLSGVAGCFPPRIGREIVHNRTINLYGGLGRNLALDFFMEQLHHKAKGMIKHRLGGYTTGSKAANGKFERTRRMSLNRLFSQQISLMRHVDSGASSKSMRNPRFKRYKVDVKKFASKFGDLFKEVKGRSITCHKYEELSTDQAMEMKKTLCDLNKKIDKGALSQT